MKASLASVLLLLIAISNSASSAPSPAVGKFLALSGQKASNQSCDECAEEFKEIDAYVTNFGTQFIVWFVGAICPQIVGMEQKCAAYAEQYLKRAAQDFHADLTRDLKCYCRNMGICPGRNSTCLFKGFAPQNAANDVKNVQNFLKMFNDVKPTCKACIDYFAQMDAYVTKFGPVIIDYVSTKICPQIKEYEATCKMWSRKYLERGIERAHDRLEDAMPYCKAIGAC